MLIRYPYKMISNDKDNVHYKMALISMVVRF